MSWLINLFQGQQKPCLTCGQITRDILVLNGGKPDYYYCRQHLIDEFSKIFNTFPYRMVVFHPELDRKYCSTMYPYYPTDDMVQYFHFPNSDQDWVRKTIQSINGVCTLCQENKASMAYFSKGILSWGRGPEITSVTVQPQMNCSKCTLRLITPDLINNLANFSDNGLLAPYKGEGIYVNTQL